MLNHCISILSETESRQNQTSLKQFVALRWHGGWFSSPVFVETRRRREFPVPLNSSDFVETQRTDSDSRNIRSPHVEGWFPFIKTVFNVALASAASFSGLWSCSKQECSSPAHCYAEDLSSSQETCEHTDLFLILGLPCMKGTPLCFLLF